MILAKPEILKAIKKGRIKITPFNVSLLGPCSVDFRLGKKFKKIRKKEKIHIKGNITYKDDFHETIEASDIHPLILKPQELVLGVSLERFALAPNMCGWIQGRSRLARLGLMVHVSSSFIQPGSDNHQVLEIVNMSPQVLCLYPGAVVGQVVFQEVKGRASYAGMFQHQEKP